MRHNHWPARTRQWPPGETRSRAHRRQWKQRGHFFLLRVAAFFVIVLSLSAYGAVTLFRALIGQSIASALGPFWPVLALLLIAFTFGATMLRIGRPLGDIVGAAERVAAGDLKVRLTEHGAPWVRSVAAAFNSMTARLELQRRQRRDLMADVAHELRTPLTVMQGRLEGMIDGVYPRDEQQLAQVLEETRMLSRLVEDLRTLAHSESGTLALQKEMTDVAVLLEEAAASFRPEAEPRGVVIETRIAGELPLVEIDPLRIREVVTNLLANAVRHAPKETTVLIEVDRRPDAVIVRVRDEGPGIAAEDMPHIFDRFFKDDASHGSGLGLTIARNLVVAHGGTIAAESQPGNGTTIIVSLPIAVQTLG